MADVLTSGRSLCPVCDGSGEYFSHADNCDDDLCALNGDEHSCLGWVIQCECMATVSPISNQPAPLAH